MKWRTTRRPFLRNPTNDSIEDAQFITVMGEQRVRVQNHKQISIRREPLKVRYAFIESIPVVTEITRKL